MRARVRAHTHTHTHTHIPNCTRDHELDTKLEAQRRESLREPDACSFVATITLYLLAACLVRATQFLVPCGGVQKREKKKKKKKKEKKLHTRRTHVHVHDILLFIPDD